MKKFVLLFRMDIANEEAQPTSEQMKAYMEQWMAWINEIAGQRHLSEGGNHLSRQGRVLRSDGEVLETPYISGNNSVAGYIIILAKDIEQASKVAGKCPILNGRNTSVEIREVEVKE